MPPQLPIDILPEILRHFVGELDEQEILHNLLFVNRTWCQHSLPLLWTNPFLLCQQPENRAKLVETVLGCLSDDDKGYFAQRNPDLPIYPRPSIDYSKYITILEEKNVIEAVNNCKTGAVVGGADVTTIETDTEIDNDNEVINDTSKRENERKYEATVLSAMLYKMFVERSNNIKWFNLDCDAINAKWYDGTITHQDYMADKILEAVAKHQQSLTRLAVAFNSGPNNPDTPALSKLVVECIKVQGRFLNDFVIENAGGDEFAEMHYALKPRANSLKRVGYTQCDFAKFPWAVGIEILLQVEELYFIACTNLRDSQLKQLEGRMEKPFPEFYYYVLKGLE
ncbi:4859_t:CDS:2 [Ambispora leptoticha]|uniref:4859_t:CDS:1 n=1 Tax=Ambispora leptoticha TaxID=144679 RepID=A0A9N9GTX5_9GLOM|nr:4859_t:CDS:2 [Ambispora leptoticha]